MSGTLPGRDLFSVLVESARERTDELTATAEVAKKVDAAKILRHSTDSNDAARRLAMASVAVACSRIDDQMAMVRDHMVREGVALKAQDPTKIPAISDVDIATSRSKVIP